MAPTHFNLFPAPSTGLPRKTSLRKIKTDNVPNVAGEVNLKGVAFQVVSSPRTASKVQPATETIKHSFFCEPSPPAETLSSSPDSTSTSILDGSHRGPLRRQTPTRRRSSRYSGSQYTDSDATPPCKEDELSPLPNNNYFGSSTPPKRSLSSPMKRPNAPSTISTTTNGRPANVAVTPVDEKDGLSPLPDKTQFKPRSPSPPSEYPSTFSDRYGNPARSKSPESAGYGSPMRSMFPRYDPSRPLDRQQYYPTTRAPSPATFASDNVSKMGSPVEKKAALKRYDSAIGLVDKYEHIPSAAHADLEALWRASREEFPVAGRKVSYGLYQPSSKGTALAIGTSHEDLIYSMEKDRSGDSTAPKQFAVKKHCPTAPSSSPVAQLVLPSRSSTPDSKDIPEATAIFPQTAAIQAIEAISSSPEAHHIATFDPTAESPEAARLAQYAVAEAHGQYSCDLVKKTRKRDSLGTVTAQYDLKHPLLGTCAVTVTKSQRAGEKTGPRAKISLHHPSATPAAIAADTLNLAFLDFAHDACVLDVPGLLALDSHYIVDTVVCALLAVAVIENDTLVTEQMTFEAPPTTPLPRSKKEVKAELRSSDRRASVGSSTSKGLFKRSGTKKDKKNGKVQEMVPAGEEEVELPGLARGALAVVGFGFKATAWVIVSGVKVGFWGVGKVLKRVERMS